MKKPRRIRTWRSQGSYLSQYLSTNYDNHLLPQLVCTIHPHHVGCKIPRRPEISTNYNLAKQGAVRKWGVDPPPSTSSFRYFAVETSFEILEFENEGCSYFPWNVGFGWLLFNFNKTAVTPFTQSNLSYIEKSKRPVGLWMIFEIDLENVNMTF